MWRCLKTIPAVVICAALTACSVNPATGRASFTAFMSPDEELAVGSREHPAILRQFSGAYGDRRLAEYVERIGHKLAAVSEMAGLEFHFTVLNHDVVNAFALPGGYVYVSRGLLAIAGNEAEMAGVLAHEIGHVTARHSAQRYSQAMAANVGLSVLGVVGSVFGFPIGSGELASVGMQALLQGYSRDQELEADMLGVRYMTRAGFDPHAMTSFFRKLQAHQALEARLAGRPGGDGGLDIMATHPRTVDRIEQAIKLSKATAIAGARIGRDAYLTAIDGMIFGDDPGQGIRAGRDFSHAGLGVRFTVPPGYVLYNHPDQVVAQGPGGGLLVFDLALPEIAERVQDLRAYVAGAWGGQLGVGRAERLTVNGLDAATGAARVRLKSGVRDVRLVALNGGPGRLYRLMFITPPDISPAAVEELERTTHSFRRLSPSEAAAVRPLRIRVVRLQPGDSPRQLAANMPLGAVSLDWFNLLNGIEVGAAPQPGTRIKTVGY